MVYNIGVLTSVQVECVRALGLVEIYYLISGQSPIVSANLSLFVSIRPS